MPPTPARQIRRRRLTQQERSAATRQELIDATIESILDVGYERSTTTEISDRAGLSRGAFQHHWQTRAGLIAAAAESLAARGTQDLQEAVQGLPSDDRRPAAALDMVWELFTGPLFQVMVELSVHARTDPELRAALDPVEEMVGRAATPWMRAAFGAGPQDKSVDSAITLITATVRGLAVVPLLEPNARVNRRWAVCRAYLIEVLDAHRSG